MTIPTSDRATVRETASQPFANAGMRNLVQLAKSASLSGGRCRREPVGQLATSMLQRAMVEHKLTSEGAIARIGDRGPAAKASPASSSTPAPTSSRPAPSMPPAASSKSPQPPRPQAPSRTTGSRSPSLRGQTLRREKWIARPTRSRRQETPGVPRQAAATHPPLARNVTGSSTRESRRCYWNLRWTFTAIRPSRGNDGTAGRRGWGAA